MFHSSGHFHWYDTNRSMLETAVEAGGIALAVSAAVVFLSSRSLSATTFAVVSIAYVLTAVTACVVAMGWELGFLEAICFAILRKRKGPPRSVGRQVSHINGPVVSQTGYPRPQNTLHVTR